MLPPSNEIHTLPGLTNKVAIVTGVSSGIGRAVCASFLASGVKVLGVDIKAAPYDINDDNFSFLQIDLIRPDSSDLVARACNDKFGERIDILVNNAGIMDNSASADTLDDETWERNIEINLTSPVKLMRAVLPSMKAQGYGSIVNVSTKAGNSGAVSGIAYSAAKHGLHGATKNVAWRFRDDGIRCNCIAPGGVNTNITDSFDHSKRDMEAYHKHKPIHELHIDPTVGRNYFPSPQDMTGLILYLASDLSRAMSGSIIPIDLAWCAL